MADLRQLLVEMRQEASVLLTEIPATSARDWADRLEAALFDKVTANADKGV